MTHYYIPLSQRTILKLTGNDSMPFLQALLTSDISQLNEDTPLYALLLTPQGKYLYDFFLVFWQGAVFLDVSAAYKDAIITTLSRYRLRRDVAVEDVSDVYESVALLGERVFSILEEKQVDKVLPFCKGVAYLDPRSNVLYARAIIERENRYQSFHAFDYLEGTVEDYKSLRIQHGVPSGDVDLISGSSFPLHFSLDQFHAISFTKGCYIGQEVTARMHHKAKAHKQLVTVKKDHAPFPQNGEAYMEGGKKKGVVTSQSDELALVLMDK